jgi:hypothetical protein
MRADRPHWRCPTPGCSDACYCEPDSDARRLRHVACDKPAIPLGPVPTDLSDRRRELERRQLAAAAATLAEEQRPATFTVDGPEARARWEQLLAERTRSDA